MKEVTRLRQQFRQSIRTGTGKAYLLARSHPEVDFSGEIIKASVKCYVYDYQCEGSRAEYISGLIDLSGKKDRIVEAVLKALAAERDDWYNLEQLFQLAYLFARDGNQKARKAIYKRFNKKVIKGAESTGEDEIIKLGGIEGLKYVAEIRDKDVEDWEICHLVEELKEYDPNMDIQKELKRAAKSSAILRYYARKYKPYSKPTKKEIVERRKQNKKDAFEKVKKAIDAEIAVRVPIGYVRYLTQKELKILAEELRVEKDVKRQCKYLHIFSRRQFPLDYHVLLDIVKKPSPKDANNKRFACRALGLIKGGDIRQLAIEKLMQTNNPQDYLYLLVNNYRDTDCKLLTDLVSKFQNWDIIHNIGFTFIDIYEANKTKTCKRPLEALYEKMPCSLCRYGIVQILIENNVLSKRILKEMEYDCDDGTREFYHKIVKKKKS